MPFCSCRAPHDQPAAEPDVDPYADAVYSRVEGDDVSVSGSQSGEECHSDNDLEEYDPLTPVSPTGRNGANHLDMAREWQVPQSMTPSGLDAASDLQQVLGATQRASTGQHVTFNEPQMMHASGDDNIQPQALSGQLSLNTGEHGSSNLAGAQSPVNAASLFADLQMQSFTDSASGDSSAPRAMMSGHDDHMHSAALEQARQRAGAQLRGLPVPLEMNSTSDDRSQRSAVTPSSFIDDTEVPDYGWSGASSYRSSVIGKAPSLATIDEESGESDSDESEGSHHGSMFSAPLTVNADDISSPQPPEGLDGDTQSLNLPPFAHYIDDNGVQNVVACLTGNDDQPVADIPQHAASGDGNDSGTRAALSGCLSLAALQSFVQRKEEQHGSVHRHMQAQEVTASSPLSHSETVTSAERQSNRCASCLSLAYMSSA